MCVRRGDRVTERCNCFEMAWFGKVIDLNDWVLGGTKEHDIS